MILVIEAVAVGSVYFCVIMLLYRFQICGGGPKLSAWHLRSLSSTTVFDTPGACQQHVLFYEDTVSFVTSYLQLQKDSMICTLCNLTAVYVHVVCTSHVMVLNLNRCELKKGHLQQPADGVGVSTIHCPISSHSNVLME